MPQENQVLRCFSCETFQVHIVKKSRKWECKICGAKQSFKRHYGKGSGKDCRNHVMKLNELRASKSFSKTEGEAFESEPVSVAKRSVSKWAKYLDEDNDSGDENYKPVKKRKLCEDDEVGVKLDADTFENDQSNVAGSSKQTNMLQAEEDKIKTKKSKNIFESDVDDFEDILNFI